jgi:hypothetical protein
MSALSGTLCHKSCQESSDQLDEEMVKQGITIYCNTCGVESIKSDGLEKKQLTCKMEKKSWV